MNYKHIQLPLSKLMLVRCVQAMPVCSLVRYTPCVMLVIFACSTRSARRSSRRCLWLTGQVIFYAGPTPPKAGRPFGAIGPTTSSRMDFAAPLLMSMGLTGTIGKGERSDDVKKACKEYSSVYFVATGGAAAFLAKCVVGDETLAYDDLGTEALRRIDVVDLPVFVGIDTLGTSIYSLED